MSLLDERKIEDDLLNARPIAAVAVEAWMGKPYEEHTLLAVEDGYVSAREIEEKLGERYPLRTTREPDYKIKLRLPSGEVVEQQTPWLMLQAADAPPVILVYPEGVNGRDVQAVEVEPGFVARNESGASFRWEG